MKIAILTIMDGQNYGNRLQNYALQEVLKQYGSVESIQRRTVRDKTLVNKIKADIKLLIKWVIGRDNPFPIWSRAIRFKRFNRKYMNISQFCTQKNEKVPEMNEYYDLFVCGSDQIWNPTFPICYCDMKNNFAYYAPIEKRVSYAASFGLSQLPEKYVEEFREYLLGMKYISVREDSGKDIVNAVAGRQAQVVLDPTMMLTQEQWAKIAKKPKWIDESERFVLTYFLGKKSDEQLEYFQTVGNKANLKFIHLENDIVSNGKSITNSKFFSVTPDEFVWLVKHSSLIFTDSFHACVFSILFEKPFRVFDRNGMKKSENMNSRMDTLLGKLEIRWAKGNLQENVDDLFYCEYQNVPTLLEKEREQSRKYLEQVFHG